LPTRLSFVKPFAIAKARQVALSRPPLSKTTAFFIGFTHEPQREVVLARNISRDWEAGYQIKEAPPLRHKERV
jgi:hypothetical protein